MPIYLSSEQNSYLSNGKQESIPVGCVSCVYLEGWADTPWMQNPPDIDPFLQKQNSPDADLPDHMTGDARWQQTNMSKNLPASSFVGGNNIYFFHLA